VPATGAREEEESAASTQSRSWAQRGSSALVARDDSSTPADSAAFMWQKTLVIILCTIPSTVIIYAISLYMSAVGNLYFGEDGLGAPVIYRKPPSQLDLPEGAHLAVAPFRPYELLKYGLAGAAWARCFPRLV
jgi:hypothetical protein